MNFKKIVSVALIFSIMQPCLLLPFSTRHYVKIGSGKSIGVEVPAGGIALGSNAGDNNEMLIGPHQGCTGFHKCGSDLAKTAKNIEFDRIKWFEIDPAAVDANGKHPRIRECAASFGTKISENADIYLEENCVAYVVESGNKKHTMNLQDGYKNLALEPALSNYLKRHEQPELTPEQKEVMKKLEDAGWKKGPLGQLVPPSIGQAIQKATKK